MKIGNISLSPIHLRSLFFNYQPWKVVQHARVAHPYTQDHSQHLKQCPMSWSLKQQQAMLDEVGNRIEHNDEISKSVMIIQISVKIIVV